MMQSGFIVLIYFSMAEKAKLLYPLNLQFSRKILMTDKNRDEIYQLIENYVKTQKKTFVPVKDRITYSEPAYGHEEIVAAVDSLFNGWLAEGPKILEFEEKFAKYIGVKDCVMFNSGSSALLIAFALLRDKTIDNPLTEGDEIITSAVLFPTALSAITLNGLTPVLTDVEVETLNINADLIESVITPRTRAILVSHNLGNPCNMDKIMAIARKHDLYVVEDCCDSHGAEYGGKKLGSFGDLGCFSFHAGHTLATGEGGAITFNNLSYRKKLLSFKACGRDEENGKMQEYTRLAYKLRMIDLQAAMGIEQLKKSDMIVNRRVENFNHLCMALEKYKKHLMFVESYPKAKPVWFSTPFTVREDAPFSKDEIVEWLESQNIQTRPILGSNIMRQPAVQGMDIKTTSLKNSDAVHERSFYVGCHPNLTAEMMQHIVNSFEKFLQKYS